MCSLVCALADDCEESKEELSSSLLSPQESSEPSSTSDNDHCEHFGPIASANAVQLKQEEEDPRVT